METLTENNNQFLVLLRYNVLILCFYIIQLFYINVFD